VEARKASGIGMPVRGVPAVENHAGLVAARFHWNFATKAKQASAAFQKDLKCLRHIGLEGLGAAAA
jgi:hypothetical protein